MVRRDPVVEVAKHLRPLHLLRRRDAVERVISNETGGGESRAAAMPDGPSSATVCIGRQAIARLADGRVDFDGPFSLARSLLRLLAVDAPDPARSVERDRAPREGAWSRGRGLQREHDPHDAEHRALGGRAQQRQEQLDAPSRACATAATPPSVRRHLSVGAGGPPDTVVRAAPDGWVPAHAQPSGVTGS